MVGNKKHSLKSSKRQSGGHVKMYKLHSLLNKRDDDDDYGEDYMKGGSKSIEYMKGGRPTVARPGAVTNSSTAAQRQNANASNVSRTTQQVSRPQRQRGGSRRRSKAVSRKHKQSKH
jgi:hypothetical protein